MIKVSIRHTVYKAFLILGALFLAACVTSEDIDRPHEAENRILGLKVESVQFNTKRPNSSLNPHDETRVGTSFVIPLGSEGSFMPLEEDDIPEPKAQDDDDALLY